MLSGKQRHGWFLLGSTLLGVLLFGGAHLSAQSSEQHGFTLYEEFRGIDSRVQGQVLLLDTNLGYDFDPHIGMDLGIPLYDIRDTVGTTSPTWQKDFGDPYLDLRLAFDNRYANYATSMTVSIPASEIGVFSTGRLGAEWFNHFDHPFGVLVPSLNVGISDGIVDTRLVSQPSQLYQSFKTLGFLGEVEPGLRVRPTRPLSVGVTYYNYFPSGPQKVYDGGSNFFLQPNGPITVSDIVHDHGVTAFLRVNAGRAIYLEPGYVHSIELNDNAATFKLGIDFRALWTR